MKNKKFRILMLFSGLILWFNVNGPYALEPLNTREEISEQELIKIEESIRAGIERQKAEKKDIIEQKKQRMRLREERQKVNMPGESAVRAEEYPGAEEAGKEEAGRRGRIFFLAVVISLGIAYLYRHFSKS